MAQYRACVVGIGGIAQRHLGAYEAMPEIDLVGVADVVPASLERFIETWGPHATYSDYREMIRAQRPDLVSICTLEHNHAELTIGVAEMGVVKGILCEKPMAMNLAEADRMIEACKRNGVRLLIGHMRRYNPHYGRARDVIEAGTLGQVQMMHAFCGGWDMFLWGTHYADMLRFMNRDAHVNWVMGQLSWIHQGMKYPYSERARQRKRDQFVAEDSAVGVLQFANGVRAVFETGVHAEADWKGVRKDFPDRGLSKLSVYGTRGSLIVTDRELGYSTPSGWVEERLSPDGADPLGRDAFIAEIQELIQSIEEGRETQLSGSGGRAALEIILAIFESSRRRTIVELPLTARDNPFLEMVRTGDLGRTAVPV